MQGISVPIGSTDTVTRGIRCISTVSNIPLLVYIYQKSIECAIRHVEVARDNFEHHFAEDHDISWAMAQYEEVLKTLRELKEHIPPELEL